MKSNNTYISAVIFDLDGLLVDSEPVQLQAWDLYLNRFGHSLEADLEARMYGRRLIDAAQAAVDMLQLPVTADVVATDRDEIFLEMARGAIPPKAGARQLIANCLSAGLAVALATSGHRRYVDLALNSAGLEDIFEVQVTGEMVQRGKPHPDTFLRVAREILISPADCLVLEDSPNGVRAAISAGMHCFAVPDQLGTASAYDLADATLGSLEEVMPEIIARGWIQENESQG